MRYLSLMACALVAGLCFGAYAQETAKPPASGPASAPAKKLLIGIIAKSNDNMVFQAAHVGAKDAAKKLGPEYGVEVTIDIQTPSGEDATKQAAAIDALANKGAAGIAISCTEARTVTPAINRAVEGGAVVVCFDSDAAKSKRFCYYGTDDNYCGKMVMVNLAKAMGDKGVVAILAGNQSAPNLQARVKGVTDELAKHPEIKQLSTGVVYHVETPEKAVQALKETQRNHPEITGWALVGGWPLFTQNALPWKPGEVKVVSVDAMPAELPYVKDGSVELLLAQDCYGWGYESVRILLDKIVKGKKPEGKNVSGDRVIDELEEVTKDKVDAYGKKWETWTGGSK